MARLCYDGAMHRCFGPWYVCAIFGCAVNNPRPKDTEAEQKRRDEEVRQANIDYLTGKSK